MIKGPGLGEKILELQDHIRADASLISSLASELHSSAIFHGKRSHSTHSFRKCKDWHCVQAVERLALLGTLAPPRNPHALRQYRANLRKLQKAIKSAPQIE